MRTIVALALLAAVAAPASGPGPYRVFVSNERAHTVTIIDGATNKILDTIKVGYRARGIDFRNGRLYVALSDDQLNKEGPGDSIVSIDPATGKILDHHPAGSDPERFVLSNDNKRLIAANEDAGTATVTDLATGKLLATLVVGIEPEGVAISPNGHWLALVADDAKP